MPQSRKSNREETQKYSAVMLVIKDSIRQCRLDADLTIKEAASLLGISVPQLQNIEAVRNYGNQVEVETLVKVLMVYKTDLSKLVGILPDSTLSPAFIRPNRSNGRPRPQGSIDWLSVPMRK